MNEMKPMGEVTAPFKAKTGMNVAKSDKVKTGRKSRSKSRKSR